MYLVLCIADPHLLSQRATGAAGFERMQGHWYSESGLYQFIPEFVPRPVAFGTYASDPDMHFILLEFEDMIDDDFPPPDAYCAPPVALHLRSVGKSPTGQFGFPVNTQFGTLTLQNEWEDSWEVWFTKHMTRLLAQEEEIRGPFNESDTKLKEAFLNKVLPRYLRPLESEGRSIQPTLCHTDLWPGNVKYKLDNESILVYDANALWAHNEGKPAASPRARNKLTRPVELGMFRNPRQPFGKPYLREYWKHVPISEPEDDVESRIIIYLIRFHIMVASTWNPTDRQLLVAACIPFQTQKFLG